MYFLMNRILLYLKGTIDQYCFLINWGHRGKGQDRLFVWVISFSDVWKLKSMVRDQYGLRSKPRKNAVVLFPDLQCWSSCCINCPLSFFCLATFPLSFFCLPTFILRLFNMASQNCHAIASMGLFPFHVYLATSWHSNCQNLLQVLLLLQQFSPQNWQANLITMILTVLHFYELNLKSYDKSRERKMEVICQYVNTNLEVRKFYFYCLGLFLFSLCGNRLKEKRTRQFDNLCFKSWLNVSDVFFC